MLKTAVTTVTTDGNASIDMKINSGEEVLLTFQPAEGSASYTVTLDGEEWQGREMCIAYPICRIAIRSR